jgi:hypothetical protein
MGFHPEHSFRLWANASALLIYDWRSAFPTPKRRRLTFPKAKA